MLLYKIVAGLFKGIRLIMPKPGSVLKTIGFIGIVLGFILNYLILKPIRFLAYTFCGLFVYKKGTSHPVVGAIGYMLFFAVLSAITGGVISLIV